jgi:serine/threonine-protein kinase
MKSPGDSSAAPIAEDLTGATVGRYVISSRLGAGAMGEVYLAQHTQLHHYVAIKRLAPRLRSDEHYHLRFLREGQRASALNHPHVARVYDVLQEKGELLLVMEYVEGTTLRQRLKEGPMGTEQFLDTAIQCGEALAAAHQKGILHGDIKPENIMLTPEHQVKVLDFGVARRLPIFDESAETQSLDPEAGTIAGTPAYMAPEVLLLREPDARADIFSLGVVFYEMVSGRHPFLASSFTATTDRILHEDPPQLRRIDPDVPEAVSGIVAKAVAKDSATRYASANELVDDLRAAQQGSALRHVSERPDLLSRRNIFAVLLLAVAVLLGTVLWRRNRPTVPSQPKLAILPFSSSDGNPDTRLIAQGIRQTLGVRLAQLGSKIHVIPPVMISRTLSGAWEETPVDSAAVAGQAGANLLLQGSVSISGDRVQVRYILTDVDTQKELDGDILEGARVDLSSLEDRVARSVIARFSVTPNPQIVLAAEVRAPTVESAYEPYLEGRGYMQELFKEESIDKAITAFKRSIALDKNYALAYAGLGEAYWRKFQLSRDSQWVGQATMACQQAVDLDRTLASGHTCLGRVDVGRGKYEDAVQQFRQAVDLEPISDEHFTGLATAYENLGRLDDAEKAYLQAIKLRPYYSQGYNSMGLFYLLSAARYKEAEEMFRKAVALAPEDYSGYGNLGSALAYQGRYREAITSLERSVSLRPTWEGYSNLATAYFGLRQFEDAARNYEKALALDKRKYDVWGNLGDAYYWASGQKAKAEGAYRRAIALAQKQLSINPRDPSLLVYLAGYHAMLQERRPALDYLQRALRVGHDKPDVLFNAALVHNQLGETEVSLTWLEKALAAGYSARVVLDTPNFDNLAANHHFKDLMQRYR